MQRVMDHSGAQGVVVDVVDFVEDGNDFGVLMDRAGRPLAVLQERVSASHWLRSLAIPVHRARLWRNVRRLVIGLGIVHGQGLVHGRVGEKVVFSAGSLDPDFRLGGFEWSLWLDGERRATGTTDKSKIGDRPDEAGLSFADDWKALGNMVCRLLGVRVEASGSIGPEAGRRCPISRLESGAGCGECAGRGGMRRWKRTRWPRACDDIVVEASSATGHREGRCTLLIPRTANMAEAVFDATGGSIAIDERAAQLAFVRGDLDGAVTLHVPRTGDEGFRRLYLVTQLMVYPLRAFLKDGDESWALPSATSSRCGKASCRFGARFQPHELHIATDVATSDREAEALRDRVGRASLSWEALGGPPAEEAVDDHVQVRSALHLLEVIGAVVKSFESLR